MTCHRVSRWQNVTPDLVHRGREGDDGYWVM